MPYNDPEKKKVYDKAYREANKDKIKAKKKAYYEANADKLKAYRQAYCKANPDKVKAQEKAYREANKDRVKATTKAYYEANKDRIKTTRKAYYEANKDYFLAKAARRKALKIPALLPTTDNELIKKLYKQRAEMSKKHGEKYHVDHIIPLSIGGAHHQDNMRVITAKENLEKNDKYAPELGGVWADNDLARETKKKLGIK